MTCVCVCVCVRLYAHAHAYMQANASRNSGVRTVRTTSRTFKSSFFLNVSVAFSGARRLLIRVFYCFWCPGSQAQVLFLAQS